jgi:hypothetical protein
MGTLQYGVVVGAFWSRYRPNTGGTLDAHCLTGRAIQQL